jgi:hypothetical protein
MEEELKKLSSFITEIIYRDNSKDFYVLKNLASP